MKLDPDVFLKAAEVIRLPGEFLDTQYCCYAIFMQLLKEPIAVADAYEKAFEIFKPRGFKVGAIDFGWYGSPTPEAQDARETALCFAAAMAETGDL